jgi:AcrR family transcriptional regulator
MSTMSRTAPRPARTATTPKPRGKAAPVRQPLSTERIVGAALELVHEDGLAALSTRRIGQRLRCEAMSIYHHFPSKQHLLDGMVDHVLGGFELPPAGTDPIERVRRVLHGYRAMAHRHPAFYPYLAVHRLNTPAGVRFIESMLVLLQEAIPDPGLAARYFRAAGYYVMGASLDETSGYAKGPSAADPVSDAYVGEHCPALARSAPFFQRSQWDATFDLGLEALLAAMAADAKRLASVRRK